MHLGPIFSHVMGRILVAGLLAAHWQYLQQDNHVEECQGMSPMLFSYLSTDMHNSPLT